jgi:hypothetical protein
MPNSIKSSTSAQTQALRKSKYWIGVGDVAKGPTATTDYWSAITPQANGYTIYQHKASGGPSINVAANDADLYRITNKIAGTNYSTVTDCLNWFNTQSDKMVLNREYEAIVTSDLILNFDASFVPSYPRNGSTWYDTSPAAKNAGMINGPTFTQSVSAGFLNFDGADDYADVNVSHITAPTITVAGFIRWAAFTSGMFFGFTTYDVWTAGNALGFNTGAGDLYGISAAEVSAQALSGNYVHYAFVMTANGDIPSSNKIYINGKPQILSQQLGSTSNPPGFGSTMRISGWMNTTNYTNNLSIGTFQMYNRELTQAEITQNFSAQRARYGI